MGKILYDRLTPGELLKKYPVVCKKLGWSANDLGIVARMQLVDSLRCGKQTLITESSFLKLVEISNSTIRLPVRI